MPIHTRVEPRNCRAAPSESLDALVVTKPGGLVLPHGIHRRGGTLIAATALDSGDRWTIYGAGRGRVACVRVVEQKEGLYPVLWRGA